MDIIMIGVALFLALLALGVSSVFVGVWIGKIVIRVIEGYINLSHRQSAHSVGGELHGNTKTACSRGGDKVPGER